MKDPSELRWHELHAAEVVHRQCTDAERGLTEEEARARLGRHGPNEIEDRGGRTAGRILWEQASSFLILILLAAAGLAAVLGKWIDASAILAIVLLFVVLGFVQEYRAQRAIAALRRMSAPTVRVVRGGQIVDVPTPEVVPGDVIRLEAGNVVPADARVVGSVSLRVQEAALTGESEPVEKTAEPLPGADLTVVDRRNMVHRGTAVTFGRGAAVVVATGMATELGRIAEMMQSVRHAPTPLQRRLDGLSKTLALAAVAIAAVVVLKGWMRGEDMSLVLLTGVSLAVAIVPEGLPAVLTFTLALGARRMLGRKALVRRLPAVETLGSVTVICSDKTGTLTQNRMTATRLETLAGSLDLTRDALASAMQPAERALLTAAALCNDAFLPEGGGEAVGDPTEGALVAAAERAGLGKRGAEVAHPRVAEVAFDSDRKRMTTVHRVAGPAASGLAHAIGSKAFVSVTKGAPDGLLPLCRSVLGPRGVEPLSAAQRARIAEEAIPLY